MIIFTLLRPGRGLHRFTRAHLKDQLEAARIGVAIFQDRHARMEEEANQLTGALIKKTGELDAAGVELCAARLDNEVLQTRLRHQIEAVVRRDAEIRRLAASLKNCQQALADARPRITEAPVTLVPPYAPVSLPFHVPVGRDTSEDDTVPIPLLDQHAGEWVV